MKNISAFKQYSVLGIAFLLSILLNFFHLDYQSVWLDEIHSLNEANPSFSFSEVYDNLIQSEQMPPLYFYLLHYVFKIFGYTVIAGRCFSAVTAIVCIYAMYLLGKSLFNKQVGQMAALFLSVNQFHIYYAQEMRPYMLFELFTILSFYRFIVFLKKPNLKNSALYGIVSALTLYVHFFGLFTIAAQCCILLFFLIVMQKEGRKLFVLYSAFAGIIMLALFIPIVPIFLNILEIKVFWIPDPGADIIYLILRDFFGKSLELLLFVVIVSAILYRKSYKELKQSLSHEALLQNKLAFSFVILTGWLVVVLVVPLIKSVMSTSIMNSRYFIGLIPNLLLMFSIGLFAMAEKRKRYLTIIFVCYSLINITLIKNYYYKINKSQFREITDYIKNKDSNVPVVSGLAWYYTYFFKDEKIKRQIIDRSLEDYVKDIMNDKSKIKEFWYTEAHYRPYTISVEGQEFLNKNFIVKDVIEYHDSWARHYLPKTR